jgi:hypothetical protein
MPHWLLNQQELAIVRRAYARQMLAIANVRNDRLEQVFAAVRREDFLGDEPWRIAGGAALPVNDPVYVYQDAVLALAPERGVNNGSPSLHAKMLNDLAVEPAHRPYWCRSRLLHGDAGGANRGFRTGHGNRVRLPSCRTCPR